MFRSKTHNDLIDVQRVWGESFMANMNRLESSVKDLMGSHNDITKAISSLTANVESLQSTTKILHKDITLLRENTVDVKRVWEHIEDFKVRISSTESSVSRIAKEMERLKNETHEKLEPIIQDFETRKDNERERIKFRSGILFNVTNNGVLAIIAAILALIYAGLQLNASYTIQEQIQHQDKIQQNNP